MFPQSMPGSSRASPVADGGPAAAAAPTFRTGHWSESEHTKFVEGYRLYGRDWKQLAVHVGTRSKSQVRSHFQKWEAELEGRNSSDGERGGEDPDVPPKRQREV
jgi:SHAQKYF class myb-like DNA-binding protein